MQDGFGVRAFFLSIWLLVGATPAMADEPPALTPAPPPPPLTEFQWTIANAGALVLVPVEGLLYPARLSGEGVIETLPVQIEIALYHDSREMAVALSDLHSPFEIAPEHHILERFDGERWIAAEAMHFDRDFFYYRETPGTFRVLALDAVRFRPR
ncbi:MAG: hypothetical protein AAGI34_11345 [Pseudomonadota bacterium]